jgi:alpha-L-fucosidase 2
MQAERASLSFTRPADQWYDALPLGNGSIGAMVYGGVREELVFFS